MEEIDIYKNYPIEEDSIEFENKIQERERNKDIIRNALLIANKIAFNSHKNRFESKSIVKRDLTPGPGHYDTINKIVRKNKGAQQIIPYQSEGRAQWVMNDKEKLGPGLYYEDNEWIRPSYNVTMPNNVIYKRKEKIIQSRLDQSTND